MQHKQKRLGCGAIFVGSLFMACSLFIIFKSYLCQLSSFSESTSKNIMKPLCIEGEPISNFCEINEDIIRVEGKTSTISTVSLQARQSSWVVKPYVRKENSAAMDLVRNWSVTSMPTPTDCDCDLIHSVPAILFSLGGFSGNHFHDFSDLIIPLYITSEKFNGEVKFLVTDNRLWWLFKFREILKKLSRYDIIDIDQQQNIHCFPSMIIGLKYHKELGIHQSMNDFRQFLRTTYLLKRRNAINLGDYHQGKDKNPCLMIINRRKSRLFANIDNISRMARSLGFKVVTAEPNISSSLKDFAQAVNGCDALMGIHGAGLTNMVFLPDNAILIQIVPLGSLDRLAREYFGQPALDMKLRYLEYNIKTKESSLSRMYKQDHVIFKDPLSVHKQGWDVVRSTYLDKQNVKLDVRRFRDILIKALELLHHPQSKYN